jgi:hypothetical protein
VYLCFESMKGGDCSTISIVKGCKVQNSRDVLGDLFFFWQSMEALKVFWHP